MSHTWKDRNGEVFKIVPETLTPEALAALKKTVMEMGGFNKMRKREFAHHAVKAFLADNPGKEVMDMFER